MSPVSQFELNLALIAAVIVLQWLAARVRLPPSTMLLAGGGALAFLPGLPAISLDPELALVLFLPPLLMDGAYHTAFGHFRRHLPGVVSLAVGAVAFTTLLVGIVVDWLVPGLPWAAYFALGAIVSPPDAIAARAVLQRVELPRRLRALLEGESLLNDATGLVLFRFAVAAALTGSFSAGAALGSFVLMAAGGVAVGLSVSFTWLFVMRRLGDDMLVVATSMLLCWVAYLAGEALGVSGVIATVSAGIVFDWSQHEVLPASIRLQGNAFWRTLVFGLEALVFILIGFSLRAALEHAGGAEAVLATMAVPVIGVVAAVTAARFAWLLAADALLVLLRRAGMARVQPLGWRQGAVLGWAGMRGVVTLAVALALPAAMPGRDLMLVAAFTVILVTVVIQGGSLDWLIRTVRPIDADPAAPMDLPRAEAAIARAKLAAAEVHAVAPDGTLIHPRLLDDHRRRAHATGRYAEDADGFMADIRVHFDVMLLVIAAGRAELIRQHREGLIEDKVMHELERDLDVEEMMVRFQRGD